ncbi:MAG: hypothetical protein IAE97_07460 [Chthoniobacterales bacterium]|nr:hypothetical protein [Chthoniobacterales bacterium]
MEQSSTDGDSGSIPSEEIIIAALTHNGYDREIAAARAPLVIDFMERVGLEKRLTHHPWPAPRQIEFFTGDESSSIDNADLDSLVIDPPSKTAWHGGTWLDTAPLTYLARVCDIGQQKLGNNWVEIFKKRLRNREDLLNVLNEIWWLGCWRGTFKVDTSPKAVSGGNNDWRLIFDDGFSLNLQVKRRKNDVRRAVDPMFPVQGLFDKVSHRFAKSGPNEVNVGTVTIYGGITDAVLRCLDDYFAPRNSELLGETEQSTRETSDRKPKEDKSTNVDAIILWCPWNPPQSQQLPRYFIRARKSKEHIESAFALDPLDTLYRTYTQFPIGFARAAASVSVGLESNT